MACTRLRESCRQVEAEVVSNSRNKLHQTTYKEIFSALYIFAYQKRPIKGEKTKIKPDIKLDEQIAHILQEPKEDDSVIQNIPQNNACEVILPVYQFNNPFKLNLSIEFSEDHK